MIFMVLSISVLGEGMRVVFLVTTTVLIALLSRLETGFSPTLFSFQGPVLALCFNLAYLIGGSRLLRQSSSLDATQTLLAAEEMATRQQHAVTDAQHRMNNFIHDHILSALIPMAAGVDDREALRFTATQALNVLDRSETQQEIPNTRELFDQLKCLAIEMDPQIILRRKELYAMALPSSVGQSLLEAAHEVLNNSLRHAASPESPHPTRTLSMSSTTRLGVRIAISDDGRGFDPIKADPNRLGIRHSILQRMDTAGGHAIFDSAPGHGTRVLLSFTPAANPPAARKARRAKHQPVPIGLSMEQLPIRIIAGYAILAHLYQLVSAWDLYLNHWMPLSAWILESVMAVLLVAPWPRGVLPVLTSVLIPTVGGLANFMVLYSIPAMGWPENESWSLGFTAMLCWGLVVRGRPLAAWLGMTLLVVSSALWVLTNGLPLLLLFTITLGHVLSLAMWTLITTLAQWASVAIFRDEERRLDLEAKRLEDQQGNRVVTATLSKVGQKGAPHPRGHRFRSAPDAGRASASGPHRSRTAR